MCLSYMKDNNNNNEETIRRNTLGPLYPAAELIQDATGGWGLAYANLEPETPSSPAGLGFLITNVGYLVAGALLNAKGEVLFGTLTEIAGSISIWYHYAQLRYPSPSVVQDVSKVQLALMCDYVTAAAALITGLLYVIQVGTLLPVPCIVAGVLAVLCLVLSWIYEETYAYILWHGLWHVFGAYAGYYIGQTHLSV